MAVTLLITKADFLPYVDIPANVDATKKLNMHIEHAQSFDLRPLLGDLFFYDLLKNSTDEKYQDLLNGKSYQVDGIEISFGGIKPVIVHFATARLVPDISFQITPSGMFSKRNELSDPVDPREISRQVKNYESLAIGYWQQAISFLNGNTETYTHWRTNRCGETTPGRVSGARIYGLNSYGRG